MIYSPHQSHTLEDAWYCFDVADVPPQVDLDVCLSHLSAGLKFHPH